MHLLMTSVNSLGPDQARRFVGPDPGTNCRGTPEIFFSKKGDFEKKMSSYPRDRFSYLIIS